jgi:hypothetical protein
VLSLVALSRDDLDRCCLEDVAWASACGARSGHTRGGVSDQGATCRKDESLVGDMEEVRQYCGAGTDVCESRDGIPATVVHGMSGGNGRSYVCVCGIVCARSLEVLLWRWFRGEIETCEALRGTGVTGIDGWLEAYGRSGAYVAFGWCPTYGTFLSSHVEGT